MTHEGGIARWKGVPKQERSKQMRELNAKRNAAMSASRRRAIAKKAAGARWGKKAK